MIVVFNVGTKTARGEDIPYSVVASAIETILERPHQNVLISAEPEWFVLVSTEYNDKAAREAGQIARLLDQHAVAFRVVDKPGHYGFGVPGSSLAQEVVFDHLGNVLYEWDINKFTTK